MKLVHSSSALWSIFAIMNRTPRLEQTTWKALRAAGMAKGLAKRSQHFILACLSLFSDKKWDNRVRF